MGKFEESWKDAFEGTEVSPPDAVWINIDRDLATEEGTTIKKRLVIYQRIAAASLLFALLVGSFGVYRWEQENQRLVYRQAIESKLPTIVKEKTFGGINKAEERSSTSGNKGQTTSNQKKEADQNSQMSTSELPFKGGSRGPKPSNEDKTVLKKTLTTLNSSSGFQEAQSKNEIVAGTNQKNSFERELGPFPGLSLLPIPEIKRGPVIAEIFRKLPAISGAFMERSERKANHEQVWASVTAATGSFSSSSGPSSNYNYAANGQMSSAPNSSSPLGSAVSYGMLAGMRVTRRVVLQSGIQYMNQSVSSTSNISSPNSLAAVASSLYNSSPNYNTTSPYAISSANEFVSVPFQAGYLFVDKKMALQLNSGVSTDFFIRNTLSDPSGLRQSYSQSAGQDSPYRSVSFSGLVSSEVSYKLGNRYRVSVVPGFHYSFTSILKTNSSSLGNPMVWDVGFRFRYIFK
jgi:hypothetical protein